MKESSTRLTRKKAKEVETQINLISDRELRLLRRHNNISNTSTSPSVNDPSTTVEKDSKVPMDGGNGLGFALAWNGGMKNGTWTQ